MNVKHIGQNIWMHLLKGYLKIIEKTVTLQWAENAVCDGGQILGFWHEDSFFMNVVLKELSKQTSPVDVIITADARGDYIEKMIGQSGGHALRVKDGFAGFDTLKGIMQNAYETTRSLAVALDGPSGPRHEPKKLAFYLSEQAEEDFVGISVSYSTSLRLRWRWDNYVIPLPFSVVTVAAHNYGEVNKRNIPELPYNANMPEYAILVKEV